MDTQKTKEMKEYRQLIMDMLDMADARRLRLIYIHVKALLGLK